MGRRVPLVDYWQPAPMPREQLVMFPTSLEERIPEDYPVQLLDEILDRMDWTSWESEYHGRRGQPPIHPSILVKVLLYAMIRRIRRTKSATKSVCTMVKPPLRFSRPTSGYGNFYCEVIPRSGESGDCAAWGSI